MAKIYYDEKYFEIQNSIGRLSAIANKFLYTPYILPQHNVVDFGSGGGHYLSLIQCRDKVGVEINEVARKFSKEIGVRAVENPSQLEDDWADVIISFHALEHCHNPLEILKSLRPKLKKGGTFVLVVPYERHLKYKPNDVNQHLYTWSQMNLGNLFTTAGFSVKKVEEIKYRFPHPWHHGIMRIFGEKIFHGVARVYGFLRSNVSQIRIVAVNI